MADVNTFREADPVQHAGRTDQHACRQCADDSRLPAAIARLNQAICVAHTALSILKLEFRDTPQDMASALLQDIARLLTDQACCDVHTLAEALGMDSRQLPDAYSIDVLLRNLKPELGQSSGVIA